jgi:hypothetical protein
MDLQTLGIIAEILGAFGVVVSLLYLATQIRQAQKIARAENVRGGQAGFAEHFSSLAENAEIFRIWRAGHMSPGELDSDEIARFEMILGRYIRGFIDCHHAYQDGVFPSDLYHAWRYGVAASLKTPGGAEYWRVYGALFEEWDVDWFHALESARRSDGVSIPLELRERT